MINKQQADEAPPDGTAMHYERALKMLAERVRELEAELAKISRESEAA